MSFSWQMSSYMRYIFIHLVWEENRFSFCLTFFFFVTKCRFFFLPQSTCYKKHMRLGNWEVHRNCSIHFVSILFLAFLVNFCFTFFLISVSLRTFVCRILVCSTIFFFRNDFFSLDRKSFIAIQCSYFLLIGWASGNDSMY